MNTQEKIQEIKLTSKAVEQLTLGFVTAQRWRDLKSGRVVCTTFTEGALITLLLKNQKRVNDMFKEIKK